MARRAQKIYRDNITYGNIPIRQGQWMDRLPGIEKDMASVQAALNGKAGSTTVDSKQVGQATRAVTQRRRRPSVACSHTVPQGFQPGKPLPVTLSLTGKDANAVAPSVLLHYRHVNQAERWHSVDMEQAHASFQSAIPGEYTNSPFPLQYYFEFRRGSSEAWLYPAFNATLSNQPYFAICNSQS